MEKEKDTFCVAVGCVFHPFKAFQKRLVKYPDSPFCYWWTMLSNVTPFREWAMWVQDLVKLHSSRGCKVFSCLTYKRGS